MYLQSLKIDGFMSFQSLSWAPGRLNVLIGPNGAGKSNLLRALELIRASATGELRGFVLGKGGMPRLLWGGSAKRMRFEVETTKAQSSREGDNYQLVLEAMRDSAGFRVSSELLVFEGPAPFRMLARDGQSFTVDEGHNEHLSGPHTHLPESETVLSMVTALWTNRAPFLLQQEWRAWTVYQSLQVDEDAPIRRSAVARQETRVAYHGQNLVPVLETLYEGEFKAAIDRGMSAAFPNDYQELMFPKTEPGRIQLYVRRKHGTRQDSAADLSDGTVRFLLLLAILGTPDPPPLIAIDEPEAGLHPSMLPIIAEFAAEAAGRTQVILSSHSPQMLDAFGEDLPTVTAFSWMDDHTELRTISGEDLRQWVAEYSLGRFIFSGEAAAIL